LEPELTFSAWAGVDWSTAAHQVCLVLPKGRPKQRSFPHSVAGLAELVAWLKDEAACEAEAMGVAIEVPHGPVVAALLAAGFPTFSINPKQLDRFRDRRSLAGAKDDRLDALTLGDSLRTDFKAFSAVSQPDDVTVALRAASRRRETLLGDERRFCNRLLQVTWAAYPDLLVHCPAADEPWFWSLLEQLAKPTTPPLAAIRKLLQQHRKRSVSAENVRAALVVGPALAGAALQAVHDDFASLLAQVRVTHTALVASERRLNALLEAAGPIAEIVDSMPGIDRVLAAVFLAEAPEALAAGDYEALRTLAGTAPVTRRSGNSFSVSMRRSCNTRLRNAVRHWARTAARCAPWARQRYQAMKSRGIDHEGALRCLADRLLLRLAACLRDRTVYDPALADRRQSRPLTGAP
jgi:transposase